MELTFDQYIRKISSALLYEHLLEATDSSVISEEVYRSIIDRVCSLEGITQRCASLDESELQTIYEVYLSGPLGIEAENETTRQKCIASFLVYEALDSNDTARLYGFSDLISSVAAYFKESLPQKEVSSVVPFFWPHLDTIILLDHIQAGRIVLKQDQDIMKSSVDIFFATTSLAQLSLSLSQQRLLLVTLLNQLITLDFVTQESRVFQLTSKGTAFAQGSVVNYDILRQTFLSASQVGSETFFRQLLSSHHSVELPCVSQKLEDAEMVLLALCQWLQTIKVQERWVITQSPKESLNVQKSGHLMPDFSLIIPPEIAPYALFDILMVADIERVDMIYHAKIKQEKVLETLVRGVSVAQLDTLLRLWNAPESICHTVQEWGVSFAQVYFDTGSFLAVRPDQESTMAAISEVHELLEPITDYRVFKVKEGMEKLIKQRLLERGFDIRKPRTSQNQPSYELNLTTTPPSSHYQNVTPNFSPRLEGSSEKQVSKAGRYGGTPRTVNIEQIQKLVRYALLMDEQLIVFLKDDEIPIVFTPLDIKGGSNGTIEAKGTDGEELTIAINQIERMGAIAE